MTSKDTFTFTTEDGVFKLTVKTEFLKIIPDPATVPLYELLSSHNMSNYFHNPHGPALYVFHNEHEEYWLDGDQVSDEVKHRIKHDAQFHDELDKELGL